MDTSSNFFRYLPRHRESFPLARVLKREEFSKIETPSCALADEGMRTPPRALLPALPELAHALTNCFPVRSLDLTFLFALLAAITFTLKTTSALMDYTIFIFLSTEQAFGSTSTLTSTRTLTATVASLLQFSDLFLEGLQFAPESLNLCLEGSSLRSLNTRLWATRGAL
jgi:hypothetical protein